MRRLSAATRISIGLASLTLGAMLLANMIGLFPDPAATIAETRAELASTLAVGCTQSLARDDVQTMSRIVADTVRRNDDIVSGAIRDCGGTVLLECGRHIANWPSDLSEGTSDLNHIQIPIHADGKPWGRIELRFNPPENDSFMGMARVPWLRPTLFVAALAFVLSLLYLRRVLRYLDPMSVIPERVRTMMNTLAEAVLVLDSDQRIVFANAVFADFVGVSEDQLQGRKPETLDWRDGEAPPAPDDLPWARCLASGKAVKATPLKLRAADGAVRSVSVNVASIAGPNRKVRGMLVTCDDMTDIEAKNLQLRDAYDSLDQAHRHLAEKSEKLEFLASRDPLTGFLNRRAFFDACEDVLVEAAEKEQYTACIMIDLDHFKSVNDTYGHQVGDEVLRRAANAVTDTVRSGDIVGRYGGEEFAVILPNQNSRETAVVAERLRATIESWPMPNVQVTASIGVSAASPMMIGDVMQDLIKSADEALYEAKETGRNRVVLSDDVQELPERRKGEG
ncbi:MAG: diguanylate cyclase [Planctomycetes bacterium]|jgi:diguanylate cyclase (GGDEF)-like protein/PAS domain S-box-containing protein|nr:sensor domain-containing diguanylate cyclase [Phycisphaerae bacterium]NBB96238.1 diguanylate cyclase [Planctomycetota bacterium]